MVCKGLLFRGTVRIVVAVLLAALSGSHPWASETPDSQVNPQSGEIEIVFSASGGHIKYAIDPGEGGPLVVTTVTTATENDLGARLVIPASGDTWVVWWRDADIDQVLIRKHTYAGSWGTEELVSDENDGGRYPEIIDDGTHPWVIFESQDAGSTSVAVRAIHDDPNPIGNLTVLTTISSTGNLDALLHSAEGHLWATWVASATEVGWSEYDYTNDTWASVSYESYDNDSVEAARSRIRDAVIGN
jgi:hypothetical protein